MYRCIFIEKSNLNVMRLLHLDCITAVFETRNYCNTSLFQYIIRFQNVTTSAQLTTSKCMVKTEDQFTVGIFSLPAFI